MFTRSLKKLSAIVDSLKFDVLTPVMAELSFIMEDLALNMKNIDWREEKVAQLRDIVKSTFEVFRSVGKGALFLAENFREIIAVVALLKSAWSP